MVDVKQAIKAARAYLSEVFAGEDVADVRLEEVVYDRGDRSWLITFGLMRPNRDELSPMKGVFAPISLKRTYKIVRIPDDEDELPSIRIRELVEE